MRSLGIFWLLVITACSGTVPERIPDPDDQTSGLVRVSLTSPVVGGSTLTAEARLLEVRDIDVEAAQVLVGASTVVPIPKDACTVTRWDNLLDQAVNEMAGAVQMLDAGEVVVRARGHIIELTPRYVPEILPFVSGAAYEQETASELGLASDMPIGDEAIVSAFGGEDVMRFDAVARIPTAPRLMSINGLDAALVTSLERTEGLLVTWSEDGDTVGDTVVALSWEEDGGGELRCPSGSGAERLVIPKEVLAKLPVSKDAQVNLAIERWVRRTFEAGGLDSGTLEVVSRNVLSTKMK